ncbi:MAG: ferredoxin, partial [Clostridia bacterium]|nr:ferredoxin [Clostridia bacterium]
DMGFDDVFEVSAAAELVSSVSRRYVEEHQDQWPLISTACPSVVRLIRVRFPNLIEHMLPIKPPIELAAEMARHIAIEKTGLKSEDIGIFFISPCPAKVSYVKNGFGGYKSQVDVVVSMSDIYFMLINTMKHNSEFSVYSKSGKLGIGWAVTGGESTALLNEKYLAADGIDNVIHVLDQIENGNIPQLEFIELNACTGGCVGGVLTMQNPFIAKARLQILNKYLPVSQTVLSEEQKEFIPDKFLFNDLPDYQPISKLSNSFSESLRMMSEIESLCDILPGIDCGSCGAPTCRAFAEDIVMNKTNISECLIRQGKSSEKK